MFIHYRCLLFPGAFLTAFLPGAFLQSAQAAEKTRASVDLSTAIIQVAKQNIPAVVDIGSVESFAGLLGSLRPHQRIALLALDHRSGNTG